jgi:DNA primase
MSKTNYIDFRAVKQAVSILQILDHYNLTSRFKRSQNGESLTGACPLHNGQNPTQFRVSIRKNCWNCFGDCKSGGNILDFVSRREDCSIRQAAILISEWFGLSAGEPQQDRTNNHSSANRGDAMTKQQSRRSRRDVSRESDDGTNKPLGFELTKLDTEHPYLKERGLTADTILRFGLGFCTSGSMVGHVVIPIHNVHGEIVAYAGRWPGNPPNETPKYKLPAGFRKSVELFNMHRAIQESDDQPLVIVEGFFDCMHIVQNGYDRTIALMGSTLSPVQEQLLRQHTTPETRIVLMLDEDEAGRTARSEIIQRLAIGRFVKIVRLPEDASQPDELSAEELGELIRTW